MIKIEITDAANTSPSELRAIAQYLIAIADNDRRKSAPVQKAVDLLAEVYAAPAITPAESAKVDAAILAFEDRPDTGAPTIEPVPAPPPPVAAVVFAQPAAVPNVPAAPASYIAGVAALPTVPAVPQVTSTTPANVPLPPVPPAPVSDAQPDEGVRSDASADKTGMPWDARIHSRGRSLNADGTWRSKRGVDAATVAAVESELRQLAPVTTLADDVATAEAAWPFPASNTPVAPPPPPPVATVVSFPSLMQKIAPAVDTGRITNAQVAAILGEFGVPSLPLLAARPDLLGAVSTRIDALLAA